MSDTITKILIHGFPHCGTSILKSIIGHANDVYEYPYEASMVTNQMINEAKKQKKKYVLIKYPFTSKQFFEHNYKDYIKIFIIRNPYFVFSSLNKRLSYKIPGNHSIKEYLKTAQLFLSNVHSKQNNTHCIKYEDLFPNDFKSIKDILNKSNIQFTNDIFNNNNKNNIIVKGVKIENIKNKPSNKDHILFRTWQINQPFKYSDTPDKIDLLNIQFNELNNDIIKKLEYIYPL